MSTKKLVSVIATKSQGSSVIQSLLKNGNYQVRALLRNPDSEQSKSLAKQGVEVVKCDIGTDSKETIENALKGSDSFFLVTVFWNYIGKEAEIGKKAVDAAVSANVKQLVFSGLAPANKISGGKYHVAHFDGKYEVEEYAREISKKNPEFKSSFIYAPFYMQNIGTHFKIQKQDADNSYTLSFPSDPSSKYPLDLGDINDIGPIAEAIISNPSKYSGVTVPFAGSTINGNEIADAISKHTGKNVKFNFIPPSVFANFFPGADEMANMFSYYNEYGAFEQYKSSSIPNIKLTTFDEYLQKNPIHLN